MKKGAEGHPDKFCLPAKTWILTDTLEMSTNGALVEEMVADLHLAFEQHGHQFVPACLEGFIRIHIHHLQAEAELRLQGLERLDQIVA